MQPPKYFTPDWAPPTAQYFRCDRLSATLSTDACATNWRRAAEGGSLRCRGCLVGPMHAGEDEANASPLRGQMICARCQRGATRLISGWLDVSCYNREREWKLGSNAKGSYPSRMLPLAPRSITYTEAGEVKVLRKDLTQTREELMVGVLRDAKGVVAFHGSTRSNLVLVAQGALW